MARPDEDPNGASPAFLPFEADPPSGTESGWSLLSLVVIDGSGGFRTTKARDVLSRLTVQGSRI